MPATGTCEFLSNANRQREGSGADEKMVSRWDHELNFTSSTRGDQHGSGSAADRLLDAPDRYMGIGIT
jgi:hypothetical protein